MKRAINLIAIYIGLQILFLLPVTIIIESRNIAQSSSFATMLLGMSMILSSVAMGWYLLKKKYVTVEDGNFDFPSFRLLPLLTVFTIALVIVLDWVGNVIQLPDLMQDTFQSMGKDFFGIVSICIIGPILEELLFRGAIMGHMLKKYKNPKTAILLSALIFGIIHGNPAQIPFAILMGLVLGAVYYRTGSLVPCIFMHVLNNSFSTTLSNLYPDVSSSFDLMDTTIGTVVLIVSVIIVLTCAYILKRMYPKPMNVTEE